MDGLNKQTHVDQLHYSWYLSPEERNAPCNFSFFTPRHQVHHKINLLLLENSSQLLSHWDLRFEMKNANSIQQKFTRNISPRRIEIKRSFYSFVNCFHNCLCSVIGSASHQPNSIFLAVDHPQKLSNIKARLERKKRL